MNALTVIDDSVLLPDQADWSTPPTWKLSWETEEESALRGNEGRNAMRRSPRPEFSWLVEPRTVEGAAAHQARLRAGFTAHAGQFCAPLHGRESWLAQGAATGAAALVLEATPWAWTAGDRLLVRGTGENVSIHQVTAISGYTLTISPVLPFALSQADAVAPLFFGHMFSPDPAQVWTPDVVSAPLRLAGDRYHISTAVPECCLPPAPFFDFAVIRYRYAHTDGQQLVSQTALVAPAVEGDISSFRQQQVPAVSVQPFMEYPGFNYLPDPDTEAVLIHFERISAAYPNSATITIRQRAFWRYFIPEFTGQIHLELTTYAGGMMHVSPAGNDWLNVGGQLVQTFTATRHVDLEITSDGDGQACGTIVYAPATRRFVLNPP